MLGLWGPRWVGKDAGQGKVWWIDLQVEGRDYSMFWPLLPHSDLKPALPLTSLLL